MTCIVTGFDGLTCRPNMRATQTPAATRPQGPRERPPAGHTRPNKGTTDRPGQNPTVRHSLSAYTFGGLRLGGGGRVSPWGQVGLASASGRGVSHHPGVWVAGVLAGGCSSSLP